jgi:drug/metabolite transporter (DMT)-like permease
MSTSTAPVQRAPLTSFDYVLYTVTVFAWSASWYALKLQVGVVPVQVSLVWRFGIAAAIMLVWALLARVPMKFPAKTHLKFALMGAFMFCLNFAAFYIASPYLASGLLSVVFSLASVFNILIAMMFLGLKPTVNILIGASLGFAGIAMMFWPVIAGQTFDSNALIGLGLCVAGTLFFCTGNLISASLQKARVPIISASAWGMVYGTIISAFIAEAKGDQFIIEMTTTYLASLLFLAIISSVVAFAAYLTLLGRIGSDRAGYVTVLFPVVALAMSAVLEDYTMTAIAFAGLALVLLGNIFVLGKFGKRKTRQ